MNLRKIIFGKTLTLLIIFTVMGEPLYFIFPRHLTSQDEFKMNTDRLKTPEMLFTGPESLTPEKAKQYVIDTYGQDYLKKMEDHVLKVYGMDIGERTPGNIYKKKIDKNPYLDAEGKRQALLNTMKLTPAQMILIADLNGVKMPKELMFAWIQHESGFGRHHTKDNHTRNLFGYGEYDDGTWDEKWHLKDPVQNFTNVIKQIDSTYYRKRDGTPFTIDEFLNQKHLVRNDGNGLYNEKESYVPGLKSQYNFIKNL